MLLEKRDEVYLFVVTVESTILYGSETLPLTESLKIQIGDCYTRK